MNKITLKSLTQKIENLENKIKEMKNNLCETKSSVFDGLYSYYSGQNKSIYNLDLFRNLSDDELKYFTFKVYYPKTTISRTQMVLSSISSHEKGKNVFEECYDLNIPEDTVNIMNICDCVNSAYFNGNHWFSKAIIKGNGSFDMDSEYKNYNDTQILKGILNFGLKEFEFADRIWNTNHTVCWRKK